MTFYNDIFARIRTGASILDLGCCFGQELRLLAAEGLSTDNMFTSDITPEFWDLSYTLFNDRDTTKARFVPTDVLDPNLQLEEVDGSMDIVLVTHFLHLFKWQQQVEALKRVVGLCEPEPGAMIVGFHLGSTVAVEFSPPVLKGSGSTSSSK